MSRHSDFMYHTINNLKKDGYVIIDMEVTVEDIIIKGKPIRIDILVEKDGKLIPVECGKIQTPRMERRIKLRQKYGSFMYRLGILKKHRRYTEVEYILYTTMTNMLIYL